MGLSYFSCAGAGGGAGGGAGVERKTMRRNGEICMHSFEFCNVFSLISLLYTLDAGLKSMRHLVHDLSLRK